MKLFLAFTIAALVALSHASAVQKMGWTSRVSAKARADIQARIRAAGGCNANVCFAIDGSGSINSTEFEAEKNFVLDVVSLIGVDEPAEYAGVQYGTSNSPISPLTPISSDFVLAVEFSDQLGGASFVSGGINYCFSQLFRRQGEANKIVLLGDGRSNIGASAVSRADLFRSVGGDVCAVGAGFEDATELLAIAGNDADRVFQVDNFLDAIKLEIIVEQVVLGVCTE